MEKIDLQKISQELTALTEKIGQLQKEQTALVNNLTAYKKANKLSDGTLTQTTKAETSQEVIPVGFQGVEGAYGHVAVLNYFRGRNIKTTHYPMFEDVVKAVVDKKVKYGVIPIENSSTGGITEVYDLIRRYGCFIVGEQLVKVEHCLLAWPGTKVEDIKEVYSHPQGFAQCRSYFRQHPKMELLNYFNTAKSAELVSQKKTKFMAAVAGAQAAELYGLEILARGINDNNNNYTRFFVIAAEPEPSPQANKITLVLTLKHEPGSLYNALGRFAANGINMLNIESRPLEGKSWEYFFHIDISGNLIDANVQKALNEIEVDGSCRVLGNYVAAQS